MLHILGNLRGLLKINIVNTDGIIFRLHYRLTVSLLIAVAVLITTKQYVGDPIDCDRSSGVPQSVINVYCWIHATYSIKPLMKNVDGQEIVYPGVGNWKASDLTRKSVDFKYHKYYQWVALVLFLQAILFYVPRWMWKAWEGGRLQTLLKSLKDTSLHICDRQKIEDQQTLIVDYLVDHIRDHDWYAMRYVFCEFVALVNVLGQMFLMDRFFGGEFWTYGFHVIDFLTSDNEDRLDPMVRIFPRIAKCHFHKFGSSGNVETHDAVCVLPLNIVNEKIYIFLWFWFVILAVLTLATLILRTLTMFVPSVRLRILSLTLPTVPRRDLAEIVEHCSNGDCFFLSLMGQNMESTIFREVIRELTDRVHEFRKNPSNTTPTPEYTDKENQYTPLPTSIAAPV